MSGVLNASIQFDTLPLILRADDILIFPSLLGGVLSAILDKYTGSSCGVLILLAIMIAYYKPTAFTYGIATGLLGYGIYRCLHKYLPKYYCSEYCSTQAPVNVERYI